VPSGLLSPSFWAVQKKHLTKKTTRQSHFFAECQVVCWVQFFGGAKKHLTKKTTRQSHFFAECLKKGSAKTFFIECKKKTLPSVFLTQGKQLFKIHILMHKMTSNERVFKVVTLLKTYKVYFDRFFI